MLLYETRFDEQYEHDAEWGAFDGMAHPQGPVIFAADALDHAWDHTDGSNVVLHELSHLFDFDSAGTDGMPSLVADASAEAWAALVRREMQRVRVGRSLLRSYAAHNAAEFFAVSTEVFFERPFALARRHPELFAALTAMYAVDPRQNWPEDGARERVEREA
jgi:MtfA peptidase